MKHMGGFSDMTPGRNVRGGSAIAVRVWHIVISPKGSIPQDPALGWGLPSKLGTKATETSLKVEAAIGRDEIKKDPEVRDASVKIEPISPGHYRVEIIVFPTEGATIEIIEEIEANG
jgi:hypothetical protein